MDWAQDNTGLQEHDLDSVFRYAPRESSVVEMLGRARYEPAISTLKCGTRRRPDESKLDGSNPDPCRSDPHEWQHWLEQLDGKLKGGGGSQYQESGLVLVLARREGENTTKTIRNASKEKWLRSLEFALPSRPDAILSSLFSKLPTKAIAALRSISKPEDMKFLEKMTPTDTRRSVRTLPFHKDIFKLLTHKLQTHGTIAKAISRSDVPMFSCDKVEMGEPAYVYNCRTPNSWKNDLAMSVTHFPNSKLTLAIIYGTTIAMEKDIINKLGRVRQEVLHPLLLLGLFTELERTRHAELVKEMGVVLEVKTLEFQVSTQELKGNVCIEEKHRRNKAKREAWLNTSYLKNQLLTWKTQVQNMLAHAQELDRETTMDSIRSSSLGSGTTFVDERTQSEFIRRWMSTLSDPCGSEKDASEKVSSQPLLAGSTDGGQNNDQPVPFAEQKKALDALELALKTATRRITGRLSIIQDEYDDWVRDCSTRVEGMAMATQWASGETNVEIALSTRRDSKYMRSIAILTMIFLPGTWLAGVFSMTFFDWKTENGGAFVSSFLWIYIVATIILTSITVGCWYYITVCRPKRMRALRHDGNEDDELMAVWDESVR